MIYIVTPTHLIGKYSAPYLIEEASTIENAIKQAKKRSRLSDFPELWYFNARTI